MDTKDVNGYMIVYAIPGGQDVSTKQSNTKAEIGGQKRVEGGEKCSGNESDNESDPDVVLSEGDHDDEDDDDLFTENVDEEISSTVHRGLKGLGGDSLAVNEKEGQDDIEHEYLVDNDADLVSSEDELQSEHDSDDEGLVGAFATVVPNAKIRYCCRHLWSSNFKLNLAGEAYKQIFWKAARTYTKARPQQRKPKQRKTGTTPAQSQNTQESSISDFGATGLQMVTYNPATGH
ncbi:hypothetical protein KSS87_005902 [Heliosperma pusillum]|nr:hypothetical protein KSS87_005902 [Heliosperma pusillum]